MSTTDGSRSRCNPPYTHCTPCQSPWSRAESLRQSSPSRTMRMEVTRRGATRDFTLCRTEPAPHGASVATSMLFVAPDDPATTRTMHILRYISPRSSLRTYQRHAAVASSGGATRGWLWRSSAWRAVRVRKASTTARVRSRPPGRSRLLLLPPWPRLVFLYALEAYVIAAHQMHY